MGRYTAGFKIIIFLMQFWVKFLKLSEQETYVCLLLFFIILYLFPTVTYSWRTCFMEWKGLLLIKKVIYNPHSFSFKKMKNTLPDALFLFPSLCWQLSFYRHHIILFGGSEEDWKGHCSSRICVFPVEFPLILRVYTDQNYSQPTVSFFNLVFTHG